MSDDRQIDFEETEGKTIRRVILEHNDQVLIVFTDGTFSVLYGYTVDEETTVENSNFRLSNWKNYAKELLDLGCVTQEQYDKHKAETMRYSKEARAARLAEYERLKAEFES